MVNYANQRHFASSIGIFLLVLTFLIIRYKAAEARAAQLKAQAKAEAEALVLAEAERAAAEKATADALAAEQLQMQLQMQMNEAVDFGSSDIQPLPVEPIDPFESEAEDKPPFMGAMPQSEDASDILELPEIDNIEPAPESVVVPAVDAATQENVSIDEDQLPSETSQTDIERDSASMSETSEREDFSVGSGSPEFDEAETDVKIEHPPVIEKPKKIVKPRQTLGEWISEGLVGISSFVFAGVLLGLMPMWNGAVFVAAFAVLVVLFLLFPQRRQLVGLGIAAAILALPQIYYLKTGGMPDPGYKTIHWGYTIVNATVYQVVEYIGWTFGFKLLLIAIALFIANWFQRRLLIAICSLIVLTFCFQFSLEALTNHKFLNLWVVLANLFVAAGIWFLWNFKVLKTKIFGRVAAVILTILATLSGLFDLFPFHTTGWGEVAYGDDALVKWVDENTPPNSVFLSWRYTSHGILLAGRKLFYGHPYYAWGAGYDTFKRDRLYVRMFESTNPQEVFELLKENGVNYVAIDNGLRRSNDAIKKLNESIFEAYFDVVFEDTQNKYGKLTIYKVPDELGAPKPEVELPPEEPRMPINPDEAVPAFIGGDGNSPGKFSKPRGIAADDKGNFYVADTGNNRVQKFDSTGKFISIIGDPGEREGKIKEPNGVALDAEGNLFVTDAGNHKFLKYSPEGTFVEEFMGPDTGFYGPRDLVVAPNNQIYIVDQGRTRVARFQPASENFSYVWGVPGTEQSQFKEPTGIGVGDNMIFVADLGNGRVQAFDLEGRFVREWPIPTWERTASEFPDIVFDDETKTFYVTSPKTNEVLAFDVNGAPLPGFSSQDDQKLDSPASMAILTANKKRWLLVVNSGSNKISKFELQASQKPEPTKTGKNENTKK